RCPRRGGSGPRSGPGRREGGPRAARAGRWTARGSRHGAIRVWIRARARGGVPAPPPPQPRSSPQGPPVPRSPPRRPARRLIERSRSVGEVLRWVTQNPGKVSASHYPIALHKLGQLLQQQQGPAALNGESRRPGPVLEQPEFQTLCQAIISGCSKFDNFSIVNCLYAAAALGHSVILTSALPSSLTCSDPPMAYPPQHRPCCRGGSGVPNAVLLLQGCPGKWLPRKAENLTPYTMALIAKYVARHRLREPRLLDTIANFLLKRGEQLDSKVIQKLVFPFSRMNYRPSNHSELFPKLEAILEQKAGSSPLATVNILMSMFQLSHFPQSVLHQVFSPAFITNVMSTPYALIVRRYLSLLDAAVELEFRDYSGPRLDPRYRVLMFEHALTCCAAVGQGSPRGPAEGLGQMRCVMGGSSELGASSPGCLGAAVPIDFCPLPAREFPPGCAMLTGPGVLGPIPCVWLQPCCCRHRSCRSWPSSGQGEPPQPRTARVRRRWVLSARGLVFLRKQLSNVGLLPSCLLLSGHLNDRHASAQRGRKPQLKASYCPPAGCRRARARQLWVL
uniref:Fas activated serine/threonine kinase n=1 Tax=Pavo cristatus TaxID=9049 RepID=A0A8C9F2T5_PAVCR